MRKIAAILGFVLLLGLAACEREANAAWQEAGSQNRQYLENKGSDTIVNLALAWAEIYQNLHPEVSI